MNFTVKNGAAEWKVLSFAGINANLPSALDHGALGNEHLGGNPHSGQPLREKCPTCLVAKVPNRFRLKIGRGGNAMLLKHVLEGAGRKGRALYLW